MNAKIRMGISRRKTIIGSGIFPLMIFNEQPNYCLSGLHITAWHLVTAYRQSDQPPFLFLHQRLSSGSSIVQLAPGRNRRAPVPNGARVHRLRWNLHRRLSSATLRKAGAFSRKCVIIVADHPPLRRPPLSLRSAPGCFATPQPRYSIGARVHAGLSHSVRKNI